MSITEDLARLRKIHEAATTGDPQWVTYKDERLGLLGEMQVKRGPKYLISITSCCDAADATAIAVEHNAFGALLDLFEVLAVPVNGRPQGHPQAVYSSRTSDAVIVAAAALAECLEGIPQ